MDPIHTRAETDGMEKVPPLEQIRTILAGGGPVWVVCGEGQHGTCMWNHVWCAIQYRRLVGQSLAQWSGAPQRKQPPELEAGAAEAPT